MSRATVPVAFAMASLLGGCGTDLLTQGEPAFNTRVLYPQSATSPPGSQSPSPRQISARDPNRNALGPQQAPSGCDSDNPQPDKPTVRECVFELRTIIDDYYREYKITLMHSVTYGNASLDIVHTAFDLASTATPAATAKTILSAIATGLGTTKTVINEDILYKQTVQAILNRMDADRDRQFTAILTAMDTGAAPYTMAQARSDLMIYFEDGTFSHGVEALQAATAADKASCSRAATNALAGRMPDLPAAGSGCGEAPEANDGRPDTIPATGTAAPAPTPDPAPPAPARRHSR
jgi:hypothetical protein